jgi:hypothetical protein
VTRCTSTSAVNGCSSQAQSQRTTFTYLHGSAGLQEHPGDADIEHAYGECGLHARELSSTCPPRILPTFNHRFHWTARM